MQHRRTLRSYRARRAEGDPPLRTVYGCDHDKSDSNGGTFAWRGRLPWRAGARPLGAGIGSQAGRAGRIFDRTCGV